MNDDDQTRKNTKSNHSETQDLTWKTLPMRKVKTTGTSQQTLLTIFKSRVTTPYGGFNKSGNPNTGYMYRTAGGLRFASSEVGQK